MAAKQEANLYLEWIVGNRTLCGKFRLSSNLNFQHPQEKRQRIMTWVLPPHRNNLHWGVLYIMYINLYDK